MKKPLFILFQHVIPQHALSRFLSFFMNSKIKWLKNLLVKWFVWQYNVDITQAKNEAVDSYTTFNDFFIRELKPGARTIILDDKKIISPVDGTISQLGKIEKNKLIQAKGIDYSLEKLLAGDKPLTKTFEDGEFACIYLSPKDYHRVHMPIAGTLKSMRYVPGELFSVNDVTAQHVPGLFARNERMIAVFDTESGPMAVVMVGAMLVASIHTAWHGQVAPSKTRSVTSWDYKDKPLSLNQNDELGYFCFGSTVILLFAENKMTWQPEWLAGSGVELGNILGAC